MSHGTGACPVDCPQCGKRLQVPTTHLGKQGRCPSCKFVFLLQAPVADEVVQAEVAAPTPSPWQSPQNAPAAPQPSNPFPAYPNAAPNSPYGQQPWAMPTSMPAVTGGYAPAAPSPFGAAAPAYPGLAPSPFAPAPSAFPAAGGAPATYANIPSPFGPQPTAYGMASLPPGGYDLPGTQEAATSSSSAASGDDLSGVQRFGIIIFVVASGLTALNSGGFMGPPLWLPIALLISTIGGVVGGAMLAPTHRWAGAIGGLIAGPLGLIAIAMYVHGRQQVWNVELVIVQGVACLPGVGVYHLLKRIAG